jgi:activating signal cointegrator 1
MGAPAGVPEIGGGMKALTLWQPWASLVAFGVKTIETRSWSTKYRGPLAIHAAKKTVYGPIGDCYAETYYSNVVHDNFRCYCEADGVGPPCTHGADRAPCLTKREKLVAMLPLGAVVATSRLVDVVPMVPRVPTVRFEFENHAGEHRLFVDADQLWLTNRRGGPPIETTAQLPYGDFSPGRYAWLLADTEPLDEPVPAKGRQGLWEWTP